jgi:hypothetical protein
MAEGRGGAMLLTSWQPGSREERKRPESQYHFKDTTSSELLPPLKVSSISNTAISWGQNLQHISLTIQIQIITEVH